MNYTQEQVSNLIDSIDPYAKEATKIVEKLANEQYEKTKEKVPGDIKKQVALKVLDALLTLTSIRYNITPDVRKTIEIAISYLIDAAVALYNRFEVFIKSIKPAQPLVVGAK